MTTNNKNKLILSIQKTLAEKEKAIIAAMETPGNKRILLTSEMKTGKTYLTTNNIKNHFNKQGIKVIFVVPNNPQITQLMERVGDTWAAQNSDFTAHPGAMAIITTPDSLPKEIKKCKENNKKFVLVVDEAHETILQQKFRKAFKNIEAAEKEETLLTSLYLTATPEILEKSVTVNFNKEIQIIKTGESYNGETLEIRPLEMTIINKVQTILDLSKEYDQLIYKLDNHKELKEIERRLNILNIDNHIYLTSENKKDNPIFKNIKNDEIITHDYKIIGLTSLLNAGTEIKTTGKTCILNFANSTYNNTNEIQFIGRFRNGVNRYIIATPRETEKENQEDDIIINSSIKEGFKIKPFEEFYKEEEDLLLNFIATTGKTLKEQTETFNLNELRRAIISDSLELNEETREYTINYAILTQHAFNKFHQQFLKNPELLLNKFKECKALYFDNYVLNEEGGKKPDNKILETEKASKEIKELKTKIFKDELTRFTYELINLKLFDEDKKEEFLKIINLEKDNLKGDLLELCEIWEFLKEESEDKIKKVIKDLQRCELDLYTSSKIYLLKNRNDIALIKKVYDMLIMKKIFEEGTKEFKQHATKNKNYKRYWITREYADKHFKNGDTITIKDIENLARRFKNIGITAYNGDLFEVEKEKRQLKPALKSDIISYLNSIYKLTIEREKNKIKKIKFSSIRKNLNDLIY